MKKVLAGLAILLPVLYLGFSWYLSGLIMHGPPRRDIPTAFERLKNDWNIDRDSIMQTLPEPEEVTFTGTPLPASEADAEQAPTLHGWLFSSGRDTAVCAVVMAHGITDNRSGMLKYTGAYRDCGCELLLYDHRAHYRSGNDDLITGGIYEALDVEKAHQYLASRFKLTDKQIAWVGESWGGAAVLIAGGNNNIQPAFIHADSPYSNWETAIGERAVKMFGGWIGAFFPGTFFFVDQRLGIDHTQASPEKAAARIQVPTLIVHSAADVETSPDQSQDIYKNFGQRELAQLELLDWGSWHAQSAARRPLAYAKLVDEFKDRFGVKLCDEEL